MAVPNSITMLNNACPLNFRGRCRRGFWVVGIVERATGRCWLERVRRRDAPTLERIIAAHVLRTPGEDTTMCPPSTTGCTITRLSFTLRTWDEFTLEVLIGNNSAVHFNRDF